MLEHVLIGDAAPGAPAARRARAAPLLPAPAARRALGCPPRAAAPHGIAARASVGRARRVGARATPAGTCRRPTTSRAAHAPVHALEHASFVAAGFLVWTQLVDPAGRRTLYARRSTRVRGRAVRAAARSSATSSCSRPSPLYPGLRRRRARRCTTSSSPGVVMMAEQVIALGVVRRTAAALVAPQSTRAGPRLEA